MVLDIRRELLEKKKDDQRELEGIIKGKIKYGKESLKILGMYMNQDLAKKL